VNLVDTLRYDYGCSEETTGEVVRWASALDERERTIFYRKLCGESARGIAREIGVSHTTVSMTIRAWDGLRDALEEKAQRVW
jgi:DNA-binding NarL/FixJ family response regulator